MQDTNSLYPSAICPYSLSFFQSDWGILAAAKLPHDRNAWYQGRFNLASLDHTMWFHDSFRADEWLLADVNSTHAIGGRGLAFSKFFTKAGKLVVSCAQEGVMRLTRTKPASTPLSPQPSLKAAAHPPAEAETNASKSHAPSSAAALSSKSKL